MSVLNGPTPSNSAEDGETTGEALQSFIRQLITSPPKAIQLTAFWIAVMLPFLYLPLLVTGVETPGERGALVSMLALNLVVLYVGHGYQQPNSTE